MALVLKFSLIFQDFSINHSHQLFLLEFGLQELVTVYKEK